MQIAPTTRGLIRTYFAIACSLSCLVDVAAVVDVVVVVVADVPGVKAFAAVHLFRKCVDDKLASKSGQALKRWESQ